MRLSGIVFKTARFRIGALALGLVGAVIAGPNVKAADALPTGPGNGEFVVACENGANYLLRSGRTTSSGDVVTGQFFLSPRRAVHVRLIPMGDGYRYAGRGLWLDGIRDQAFLYLHKNRPVSCHVGTAV
ncbi:hypothetical protein ASC80_07110 [Afipia sp. Root123D2]|nr:hypothetical protein ASC80_07110 [Afipia sp. Root123D2]